MGGCHRPEADVLEEKMINISPRLQAIFNETKTVCFGRLLIKIPSEAIVVYGPSEVDASIEFIKGGDDKLEKFVSARIRQMKDEGEFLNEEDILRMPLFGKTIDGARQGQKILIGSKDQVGYAVVSFVPIQGDIFRLSINSILPEENVVEKMNKVSNLLRVRNAEEIPPEKGMCIESGFVPGVYEYERAAIGIRLEAFPDVHVSVDVHKNLNYLSEDANPKLLHEKARERAKAEGTGAVFSRVEILRDQDRQLSIWSGHEMAFRTPSYKKNKSVHEFRFHSVGAVNDPFHPALDIRLDTGVSNNQKGATAPSINDDEALALWDFLIKSIRLRQPSDATTDRNVMPKMPIGSTSKSGEKCPQTGLWECTDKRRIDGERRRLFEEGEKIPPVIATGHISFWRTLIGDVYRVAYVDWKLVAYESTPPHGAAEMSGNPALDNPAKDHHA